jgi:shikimate dehydrogenase
VRPQHLAIGEWTIAAGRAMFRRIIAESPRPTFSCATHRARRGARIPEARIDMADNASITGRTRLIVIVGDPIAQARSPQIYNPRLAARGQDAVLLPVHLPAAKFDDGLRGLMAIANIAGIAVTLPFKERALSFVDRVAPIGTQVGAINSMRREEDGSWTGDMFDGAGLLAALAGLGQSAARRRVVLIGAGGAGRAIAMALAAAGASSIRIADRLGDRAVELARRVAGFYPGCDVTAGDASTAGRDLLINATPVGMAPDFALVPFIGELHRDLTVADIVPTPTRTRLLELAQSRGCPNLNGAAMIDGQADAVLDFFGFPESDPDNKKKIASSADIM